MTRNMALLTMTLTSLAAASIGVIIDHSAMVIVGIAVFLPLCVALIHASRQTILDAAIHDAIKECDIIHRHRTVSGGQIVQTCSALIVADAVLNSMVRMLPPALAATAVHALLRRISANCDLPIIFVYAPNEDMLGIPWRAIQAGEREHVDKILAHLKSRASRRLPHA